MKQLFARRLLAVLAGVWFTTQAHAQTTSFTYQGRLAENGSLARGIYALRFTLYDAAGGGAVVAGPVTNSAVSVTNGEFTVSLDFGNQFPGAGRWLEIGVRTNGTGVFLPLTPRQAVTATPYAIAAITASNASSATTAGSATTATTATSFSGSLTGDVTGTQGATAVAKVGGVTAANVASGVTAANAATNTNTASALVKRDANGNFSAGTITATLAGNAATATTAASVTGNLADAQLSTNIARLNGTNVFTGTNRFSSVVLATNGNNVIAGTFVGNGSGVTNLAAAQLTGTISDARLSSNVSLLGAAIDSTEITAGTITTNNLNASVLNNTFWKLGGNAGTTPGTHFLGTTDNEPLEFKVNGQRVLRLEPANNGSSGVQSINVIAGSTINFVAAGVVGATIAGGGATNSLTGQGFANGATADFATVGGGFKNTASDAKATVAGGANNTASGLEATIAGGNVNTAGGILAVVGGGAHNTASGYLATVGGGGDNVASSAGAFVAGGGYDGATHSGNIASGSASAVGGGLGNVASNYTATVGGGNNNIAGGYDATIGGGGGSTAHGAAATVSGGANNHADGDHSTVGGGAVNNATAESATVPGGFENTAGGVYSFAAGRRAQANHDGAFVWADSTDADFASTTNDQFNVRAKGGVRLVTSGAGLTLDGQSVLTTGSGALGLVLQQNGTSPNVILGYAGNNIAGGVVGAVIVGGGEAGATNSIGGDYSIIGAGEANAIGSGTDHTFIGGGGQNVIYSTSQYSVIAGGQQNEIGAADHSFVGAGQNNTLHGGSDHSFLGGGSGNSVSGFHAFLGGGSGNSVTGDHNFLGSGSGNYIGSDSCGIVGGEYNASTANDSFIGGGLSNQVAGTFSTVPGGFNNVAGGEYSFAAGQQAQALNDGSFVWADSQNALFASTANNQFLIRASGGVGIGTTAPDKPLEVSAAVAGVTTGSGSVESSLMLKVNNAQTGGSVSSPNVAGLAFGRNGQTQQAIVGGTYGNDFIDFYTSAQMTSPKVRIAGNGTVGIGTTSPDRPLTVRGTGVNGEWFSLRDTSDNTRWHVNNKDGGLNFAQTGVADERLYLSTNGSVYVNSVVVTSDRNAKENFAPVDPQAVLTKVTALPITEWNFKTSTALRHMGPMAQDFHAAFGLNADDDRHIAIMDEGGVALAAIQGLNQKLETENSQLRGQNAAMEARMAALEKMVAQRLGEPR